MPNIYPSVPDTVSHQTLDPPETHSARPARGRQAESDGSRVQTCLSAQLTPDRRGANESSEGRFVYPFQDINQGRNRRPRLTRGKSDLWAVALFLPSAPCRSYPSCRPHSSVTQSKPGPRRLEMIPDSSDHRYDSASSQNRMDGSQSPSARWRLTTMG